MHENLCRYVYTCKFKTKQKNWLLAKCKLNSMGSNTFEQCFIFKRGLILVQCLYVPKPIS